MGMGIGVTYILGIWESRLVTAGYGEYGCSTWCCGHGVTTRFRIFTFEGAGRSRSRENGIGICRGHSIQWGWEKALEQDGPAWVACFWKQQTGLAPQQSEGRVHRGSRNDKKRVLGCGCALRVMGA